MAESIIYDRQTKIKGWEQKKIEDGIVSIVGSDNVAIESAVCLASLGIGEFRLIGDKKAPDIILDKQAKGKTVYEVKKIIQEINSNAKVYAFDTNLINKKMDCLLECSDAVICTSFNEKDLGVFYDYYGFRINAHSSNGYGEIGLNNYISSFPSNTSEFIDEGVQDNGVPIVLGGIIAEQVKSQLFSRYDELMEETTVYNLHSNFRVTKDMNFNFEINYDDFSDMDILICGAGALGIHAGRRVASLMPKRIDVLDYDIIEPTNLNRQILFRNNVGRYKAPVLAGKLKIISRGKTSVNSILKKWVQDYKPERKYDVILDCLDNFPAREMLFDYAVETGTPIISGGIDYRSGQVVSQVEGKTSCLDCMLDIRKNAERQRKILRNSCTLAVEPSVIMPAQVIGGAMGNEVMYIANPKYGNPLKDMLTYQGDAEIPLGIIERNICRCLNV